MTPTHKKTIQAYRPCRACGLTVLHGMDAAGQTVELDTSQRICIVLWQWRMT